VSIDAFTLRPYAPADEDAAIALWQRSWQQAYPRIDFAARLAWWRERWRTELVPNATVTVAEREHALCGFVTVNTSSGYLDQIVVAPEAWGSGVAEALLDEAKRLSRQGLTLHVNCDNARAIRFYEKHGFATTGEDVNPRSGAPVSIMRWPA
jgi:putative acetyltransferase